MAKNLLQTLPGFYSQVLPLASASAARKLNRSKEIVDVVCILYKYTPTFEGQTANKKMTQQKQKELEKLIGQKNVLTSELASIAQKRSATDDAAQKKLLQNKKTILIGVRDKYTITFQSQQGRTSGTADGQSSTAYAMSVTIKDEFGMNLSAAKAYILSAELGAIISENKLPPIKGELKAREKTLLQLLFQNEGRYNTDKSGIVQDLSDAAVLNTSRDLSSVTKADVNNAQELLRQLARARLVTLEKELQMPQQQSLDQRISTMKNQLAGIEAKIAAERQAVMDDMDLTTMPVVNSELSSNYFSAFELTSYVSSYGTDQTLDTHTPSWSITLQDSILSLRELMKMCLTGDTSLKNMLLNLGLWESMSSVIYKEEADINNNAIAGRGLQQGIRLSDLVQKYNAVAVYTYVGQTVPDKKFLRTGLFNISSTFQNITQLFYEQKLLEIGYKQEFIGLIETINEAEAVGSVDSVTLAGAGVLSLMGASRRVVQPSLLQNTIYTVGEISGINNAESISIFQTIFADKSALSILNNLLNFLYRIKISGIDFSQDPAAIGQVPGGFFDVAQLILENNMQRNLFTITPYLLANIQYRNGFRVRTEDATTVSTQTLQLMKAALGSDAVGTNFSLSEIQSQLEVKLVEELNRPAGEADSNVIRTIGAALNASVDAGAILAGKEVVELDAKELQMLRPYFILLNETFKTYEPSLKTPLEILSDIQTSTLMEHFERQDGKLVFRQARYNEGIGESLVDLKAHSLCSDSPTKQTILSDDLDISNASYDSSERELLSKMKFSWKLNLGIAMDFNIYVANNGKILSQFGLRDSDTQELPMANYLRTPDANETQNRVRGLKELARLFLELNNFNSTSGVVNASGDPRVIVGATYIDTLKRRISYIAGVSKRCAVGKSYTMSLNLKFVRNFAVDTKNRVVAVRLPLPTDLVSTFDTGNLIRPDVTATRLLWRDLP